MTQDVSLSAVAAVPGDAFVSISHVDDEIRLGDARVRRAVAFWIMGLFGTVNLFMLGLVVWLAVVDQQELAAHIVQPGDRLIGNEVLIALLSATTVQLGTVAVIMARSVFKD